MSGMTDRNAAWADADAPQAEPWRVLSAAEAQALRPRRPLRAAALLLAQALVGGLTALLAWAVDGRLSVLWSVLYGAAAVVLPAAVMARGLARSLPATVPAQAAARLLGWQVLKLLLALAVLALAPRVVEPLSWPALLLGMLVCLKVYWLALLWRGR